jgi:preprotein translocase subunit YajC
MKLNQLFVLIPTAFLILIFGFTINANAQNHFKEMQKTIEQLSDQSDMVVVGKVSDIHSKWNKDKSRIYTDVTVDVEEFVKGGEPGKTIVVTHPGGEVGGVGEWYSYAPKFKPAEEVMLFLHKNKQGDLNVTNSAKGKFNIKKDEKLNFKTLESGASVEGIKAIVKQKAIK